MAEDIHDKAFREMHRYDLYELQLKAASKEIERLKNELQAACDHVSRVCDQRNRYRAALEFYAEGRHIADKTSYEEIPDNWIGTEFSLIEDGDRAREALRGGT